MMELAISMLIPLAVLAVTAPGLAKGQDAHAAEVEAWHQKRIKNLTAEDGWLSLVGLHWLEPGENSAGSGKDQVLQFPANAPAQLGTFTLESGKVSFAPAKGVGALKEGKPFTGGVLTTDLEGNPDIIQVGTLRFHAIQRGDKFAIRVKDPEAKARKEFHGIPRYPVSAKYKVEARFEPPKEPKKIAVPTVMGTVEENTSFGAVVFQLDGKEYRLYPVQEYPQDKLFLIFADPTNKKVTYGAGRFLYADPPKDGKVTLDFNKSYNPPCAFSAYATCPLPPKENRLQVAIEAGEKRYGDH
jgi:uncharacterized protein (DUF1684 family)